MNILLFLVVLSYSIVVLSQEKLPNIGYLGRGYNIVFGNPQPTQTLGDPGYVDSLFDLRYTLNRTTADGRFIIPDTTDVVQVRACSYQTQTDNVYGETSYMESLKTSVSVKGSFLIASFTASFDYHQMANQTTTNHRIAVSSKALCSEYKASLMEFVSTPFSPNFVGAVKYLASWNGTDPSVEASRYYKVIDSFGTHFTTSITMGAQCTLQSLFTQETFSTLVQSGFSLSAGASASFKLFSGGSSTMTSQETQDAHKYDAQRSLLFESYLGSHPSNDGKWQTWAQTVAETPYPFEYTLAPISSLLTSDNFPEYTPNVLSYIQQKLDAYITKYCSTIPSASCSGPSPDHIPIQFTVISNSGAGDFYVSCPSQFGLLGTGFARHETKREVFPGYLFDSSTTAHCYDYFGASCYGVCTNAFSPAEIWIGTVQGTATTVSCPPGHLVTGCAMRLGQSNSEGWPYAYMSSSSSCTCYDYFGLTCQAACVPASKIQRTHEIKTNYGTGIVEAVCPNGKQALGCGYKPQTGVDSECCWYVYPSNDRCTCYNYFGATCYAVCADIYDVGV